ncbi:MAG: hypothetical protein KatS3mg082_1255 [Nitrospiraceae bacterium]|nr:MAG: hypothetical protein KatS3mg082_1255 [Nitrospiraceae bacterium]
MVNGTERERGPQERHQLRPGAEEGQGHPKDDGDGDEFLRPPGLRWSPPATQQAPSVTAANNRMTPNGPTRPNP